MTIPSQRLQELKEEAAESMGFLKQVHSTSGKEPYDRMMDLISRAVELGKEIQREACGCPKCLV